MFIVKLETNGKITKIRKGEFDQMAEWFNRYEDSAKKLNFYQEFAHYGVDYTSSTWLTHSGSVIVITLYQE